MNPLLGGGLLENTAKLLAWFKIQHDDGIYGKNNFYLQSKHSLLSLITFKRDFMRFLAECLIHTRACT